MPMSVSIKWFHFRSFPLLLHHASSKVTSRMSKFPAKGEVFFSPTQHPRFQLAPYPKGTLIFPPLRKRQICEAHHSHPSSDEVKNKWICTSTPPYVFIACCLITQGIICLLFYILYNKEFCALYNLATGFKCIANIRLTQQDISYYVLCSTDFKIHFKFM
jgi:hypothetical protein